MVVCMGLQCSCGTIAVTGGEVIHSVCDLLTWKEIFSAKSEVFFFSPLSVKETWIRARRCWSRLRTHTPDVRPVSHTSGCSCYTFSPPRISLSHHVTPSRPPFHPALLGRSSITPLHPCRHFLRFSLRRPRLVFTLLLWFTTSHSISEDFQGKQYQSDFVRNGQQRMWTLLQLHLCLCVCIYVWVLNHGPMHKKNIKTLNLDSPCIRGLITTKAVGFWTTVCIVYAFKNSPASVASILSKTSSTAAAAQNLALIVWHTGRSESPNSLEKGTGLSSQTASNKLVKMLHNGFLSSSARPLSSYVVSHWCRSRTNHYCAANVTQPWLMALVCLNSPYAAFRGIVSCKV